jgi:hypothetical protein
LRKFAVSVKTSTWMPSVRGLHEGGHVVEKGAVLGRAAHAANGRAEDLGIWSGQAQLEGQDPIREAFDVCVSPGRRGQRRP